MRAKITNSNGQEEIVEARAIILDDGSVLGGTSGVANSHIASTDIVKPQEDFRIPFPFGNEDSNAVAMVATVESTSGSQDISEMNEAMRELVIECEDASPSYTYKVEFSRNTIDWYQVGTETTVTDEHKLVPDAQFSGYAKYMRLKITPDGGQSGDQLLFKAYVQSRVGY